MTCRKTSMKKKPQPEHECTCRGDELLTTNGMFWCESHQCWKTHHWRDLCKNKPAYRRAWEEGHGPGQQLPPAERVGGLQRKLSGPGAFLRKMLGCAYKKWPHFSAMDKEGQECDVDKYAELLSEYGKIGTSEAARLIKIAIAKGSK